MEGTFDFAQDLLLTSLLLYFLPEIAVRDYLDDADEIRYSP